MTATQKWRALCPHVRQVVIAMFDRNVDDDDVMASIRALGLEGPVMSLPNMAAVVEAASTYKAMLSEAAMGTESAGRAWYQRQDEL